MAKKFEAVHTHAHTVACCVFSHEQKYTHILTFYPLPHLDQTEINMSDGAKDN